MSWLHKLSIVGIVYHTIRFYFEGGFSFAVSERLFYLLFCTALFLFSTNILSFVSILNIVRKHTAEIEQQDRRITEFYNRRILCDKEKFKKKVETKDSEEEDS